jgi:hypothetical protein
MFKPIESHSDLPEPGTAYERATLDFKTRVAEDDRFEVAKDVAALANRDGGSIVVGAAADGEYLKKYVPLSVDEASRFQRCFEEGIRDRCRPAPIFSVESIERDGGRILAVNVWPFVGQPVGVQLKKADLVRQLEDVFVYPIRVGAHTRAILPEQMHMFVDARFRRMAIALRSCVGTPTRLHGRTTSGGWFGMGQLVSLDETGNCIELLLDFPDKKRRYALPFELIEAVWVDKGVCKLRIPGYLDSIEWMPGKGEAYDDEEVLFIQVLPGSPTEREREQRVRVTQFPHQPSPILDLVQFIRAKLRRRPSPGRPSR